MRNVMLFLILLLILAVSGIHCSKESKEDSVTIEDFGGVPTESGTYSGTFNFGNSDEFPLEFSINVEDKSFSGTLIFEDIDDKFVGIIQGTFDSEGNFSGSACCRSESDYNFVLNITVNGLIGQNEASGEWVNQAGQSGTWNVIRVESR